MFFVDSTGLCSLICLLLQCMTAWIFTAFFAAMLPARGSWVRSWANAFLALAIGFTALSLRFLLAHHAVAGASVLRDGDWPTRALYGTYMAGKVLFCWCFLAGVTAMCRTAWPRGIRWPLAVVMAGWLTGFGLPTIESILLCQAVWIPLVYWGAASQLRTHRRADREIAGRALGGVLVAWSAIAVLCGAAVLAVGPLQPSHDQPANMLLRLNPLVDLTMQVVLATSLIILVMSESQRAKMQALNERDRLREQVQRDEKLRALSTMVGGVAHEINNPLTAILGYASELDDDDPQLRKLAATVVREQAERCRVIVQRMSLLGRRAAVPATQLEIPSLVRRVVRGLEPQLQAAGVHLHLELATLPRAFYADPTGVEQVLVNLLSNAVHASPRGKTVTLRVAARVDALVFEVDDQGPGVPREQRERIFEPFWTTKREGEGTGLGLAVVEAIVRTHGGRVEVADAPGGGARFSVFWNWRTAEAAVPVAAADPPRSVDPAAGRSRPIARLLVIDDEPVVRQTIARYAASAGWQVVEAESADRGLELLSKPSPLVDAIVCDLRMPGLSGIGFHDALAKWDPEWLSRIVFITGDVTSIEAAEFAARCTAPILAKPLAPAELLRRVRELAHTA